MTREEINMELEKLDKNEFYIQMHDFLDEEDREYLRHINSRREELKGELEKLEGEE